tara:strand:+ start:54 stop:743 length:690 start_codon:yes stop_codon:yes gene_type:complete
MKKFLGLGILVAGVGIGYIGKDMTSVLTANQYNIDVQVPLIDRQHNIEVVVPPTPYPVLVRPFLLPMITPTEVDHGPPSINWDIKLLTGVKHFEGYYSRAYTCAGGVQTIGYGCTDSKVVAKGSISREQACAELRRELHKAKQQVNDIVKVQLNDHQLAALTSFTFNCGPTNLKKLVDGSSRLNEGNYESVAKLLPQYRCAGGRVRKGLERRRIWELALWEGNIINLEF